MELVILLCAILSSSQQEDTSCPTTVTLWKEKEAEFNCAMNKFYHCLRNEKQEMVQTCLERSWVQPGFCPGYNSFANRIDAVLCKENLGECPVSTFWTNELYKYSACLKAVSKEQHGSKERQNISVSENDEKSDPKIFIIVIIIALVVIIVSIPVIICCRRKSNSTWRQGDRKRKKMEEMAKEADVVDCLIPLQSQDESSVRLSSATSIPKNYTQHGRNDNSLMRRKEMSLSATTEVGNMNSREDSRVAQKSTTVQSANTNFTRAEQVESLIDQHLCEPGSRLLLIIPHQNDISTIQTELLKKKPGYLKIDSFNDWSKTSDKEGYYVLLSCITREFSLAGHLFSREKDLVNIASDIEKLKLRAVIPVRSDIFEERKHNILRFDLFRDLEPKDNFY